MSYWREINGLKYHYGTVDGKRDQCIGPLGDITKKEADNHCSTWDINNGKDKHNLSKRSLESVWELYLAFKRSENRPPKSMRCLQSCVGAFIRSIPTIRDLTPAAIEKYNTHLLTYTWERGGKTRVLAMETRAHRLRHIRAFLSWMVEWKHLKASPFEIKIPAQRKDAGRALRAEEVVRLFDMWPEPHSEGNRKASELAKFFMFTVFHAGTRVTELLGDEDYPDIYPGAQYENLDRVRCVLKLGKTKSGEPRELALPRRLVERIPEGKGPIFRGQITEAQIRHYFKRGLRVAGITGRVRIHDARVTAASLWAELNPSANAKPMMDQFGWATEKMATHYTKVATAQRVKMAQNMDYRRKALLNGEVSE